MEDFIQQPSFIRAIIFFVILFTLITPEFLVPRRPPVASRAKRWMGNVGIFIIDVLVLKFAVPVTVIMWAERFQVNGWGLFNNISLPPFLVIILSVLFLDMIIYFQHQVFHMQKHLWRLHRVHDSDLDLDATSALRFHPIEIFISVLLKIFFILLIGAPPIAVLIFEIILNGAAMFNHANINIPVSVDKWLRYIIVTPDFHRIHHSEIVHETNSNYGFNVPWWDYIFKTYVAEPKIPQEKIVLGVSDFNTDKDMGIISLMKQPFKKGKQEK